MITQGQARQLFANEENFDRSRMDKGSKRSKNSPRLLLGVDALARLRQQDAARQKLRRRRRDAGSSVLELEIYNLVLKRFIARWPVDISTEELNRRLSREFNVWMHRCNGEEIERQLNTIGGASAEAHQYLSQSWNQWEIEGRELGIHSASELRSQAISPNCSSQHPKTLK